ncbi:MAG: DNRLRE domain-containing protein [Clostridia bacterium]|nr:DNRLRE domain-containing protein [Clostridia bacterium]
MKKRTVTKSLCLALVLALLTALLPMSVLASTQAEPTSVKANADTYIAYSKSNEAYGNTAYGTEDKTRMRVYCNGGRTGYPAEAWVRFNLSDIVIPTGMQIDTAKITLYMQTYKNANATTTQDSAAMNVYSLNSQDYDPETVTWNTVNRPTWTSDNLISTATLNEDNSFTAGEAAEFDVTEYLSAKETLSGNETFAFYTTVNKLDIYFYASDYNEGEYTPTLTVTYKPLENQTLKTNYDSYIEKQNGDTDKSTNTTMHFQHKGNNNMREALVGFNLGSLTVPAGKQIDTAKITVYLNSYYNYNNVPSGSNYTRVASDVSLYAYGTAVDYEAAYEGETPAQITWNNTQSISHGKIATTTLCVGDTFTQYTPYEFDISDYLAAKETLSGNELFAIYPDSNNIAGDFVTKDNTDVNSNGQYTATLTVTYKDIDEQTITALDTAFARQDDKVTDEGVLSIADNTAETYGIQNNGTSKSNRAAYVMFYLGDVNIPDGKVITEAKLKLYFTHNYNLKNTDVRIYNIADDNWSSESIAATVEESSGTQTVTATSWDNAPSSATFLSGRGTDAGLSGIATVPYESSTAINTWVDFDVTEFVTNQYYTDVDKYVSFAAHPETRRASGAVNVASNSSVGCEPKLEVKFGDAAEVTIGTPTFANAAISNTTTTVPNTGLTYITIPVSGASATPTDAKIYIAQYDSATDALVGVSVIRDLSIYSGNGTISFGYYPEGSTSQCYVKAYIWNGYSDPYMAATPVDMEAPAAEEA